MVFKGLLLFLGLLLCSWLYAQPTDSLKPKVLAPEKRDSNATAIYSLEDARLRDIDTTLAGNHRYHALYRQADVPYTLGNLGLPHQEYVYPFRLRKRISLGVEQYDGYLLSPEKLAFVIAYKPFTSLRYTQIGQANNHLDAFFAHRIAAHTRYSLHYRIVNQQGLFQQQATRLVNISFGIDYHTPNGRYRLMVIGNSNTVRNEMNGGLNTDVDPVEVRGYELELLPVFLATAQTGYYKSELLLHQALRLSADSGTLLTGRSVSLFHQASLSNERYRFFDTAPAVNEAYYGSFYTNPRGLRVDARLPTLRNTLGLHLPLGAVQAEAAADFATLWFKQLPIDSVVNTAFLRASGRLFLGQAEAADTNRLQLHVQAQLGLLANGGDYTLLAQARLPFGKWGELQVAAEQQLSEPAWLHSSIYVSQEPVWSTRLAKQEQQRFSAALSLRPIGLQLQIRAGGLRQAIYYDSTGYIRQASERVAIFQATLSQKIALGILQMEHRVMWQQTDANFLRLPDWVFRHHIGIESRFFKKALLARFGVDVRWQSSFATYAFQPVTGAFILADLTPQSFAPELDLAFDAKVKTFRFFLLGENVGTFITRRLNMPVRGYSQFPFQFRFGVNWMLQG